MCLLTLTVEPRHEDAGPSGLRLKAKAREPDVTRTQAHLQGAGPLSVPLALHPQSPPWWRGVEKTTLAAMTPIASCRAHPSTSSAPEDPMFPPNISC